LLIGGVHLVLLRQGATGCSAHVHHCTDSLCWDRGFLLLHLVQQSSCREVRGFLDDLSKALGHYKALAAAA
jgi:hypothetical protein